MDVFLEIATVLLASSIKFLAGVTGALAFKFNFFKSVTVVTLGGFLGVLVFVNGIHYILGLIEKIRDKKNKPKRKVFTYTNKLIVIAKKRFGLIGIAAIIPLLSYPLGCFIALRFFKDKRKIVSYSFLSTFIWAVIVFSYKIFFSF